DPSARRSTDSVTYPPECDTAHRTVAIIQSADHIVRWNPKPSYRPVVAASSALHCSSLPKPTLMSLRKCNSFWELFLHDVLLQTGDEREDLTFLFLRHLEFVERLDEVFRGCVPIGVCYPKPFVHDLHVPAGVNARPASAGAKLIEDVLANALLRVVAVTHEKLL